MDNANRNNYIKDLKEIRKSLELIQQKGNFKNTTDALLMLILGLELSKAEYEVSKEQEK